MKSEMSLFNRGIFFSSLRSHGWLGVVHLLALIFSVPLQVLMLYSRRELVFYEQIKDVLIQAGIFRIIILVIPVVIAILLFRYMQAKDSSVMIHSLPVSRKDLFRTKVLTGISLLIIPVAITALILAFIRTGFGLESYYTLKEIFLWFSYTFILELIMFLAAVLVGMVTGMSTAQGVLTYIMLLLPVGFSMLVLVNLEFLIYGFTNNFAIEQILNKFSPIMTIIERRYEDVKGWTEFGSYIVVSAGFYILAQLLYQRRRIEAATQTIAFHGLKHIFKYGVTFCCMLVGGIYFRESGATPAWVYLGYIFGSFFGYLAAEMIVSKSIKVFDKLKGYGVYAVIMLLIFTIINLDLIGYQGKVPELADVQSIYFGSSYYGMPKEQINMDTYTEAKTMEKIRELHKTLTTDESVKEQRVNRFWFQDVQQFVFVYKLKNGDKMIRGYNVPLKKYESQIKAVYKELEYKKRHNPELGVNAEKVNKIIISPTEMPMKKAIILNPEEIKEALALLKKDIINTEPQIIGTRPPRFSMMLFLDDGKDITSLWNRGYENLEKWLKEKGYWEKAIIQPQDISYIRVEKINYNNAPNPEQYMMEKELNGKNFYNKQQIAECLDKVNVLSGGREKEVYQITFYSEDKRQTFMGQLYEKSIPSFITEAFNK